MGTAKLVLVGTDIKTKRPMINSGFTLARSDHQHWTMMGSGPVLSGSVADQIKQHTGTSETLIQIPTANTSHSFDLTAGNNDSQSLRR